MKRLLVAALMSVFAVGSASAFFGRDCGTCGVCPETCEPRPICYKMVRKECPARKVCERVCHWECPSDTIREDGN